MGVAVGCSADASSMEVASADSASGDESITNNQESGVDEGDIVKVFGDYFVVLRRGRLFTVRQIDANEPGLVPISEVDVYPPGYLHDAWYDEMLIHDDLIVVIGYSYEVRATEVGLFRIDEDGGITHEATHFLSSNDYYSSRNYASRLVDGQLIFYMPHYMGSDGSSGCAGDYPEMPSISTWQDDDDRTSWNELITESEIWRPSQSTLYPTLHTVVRCDLDDDDFECTARGLMAPFSRSFYVTRDAVYLWVSPERYYSDDEEQETERPYSYVYRMPLDDEPVVAARAVGSPIDQFSFLESDDGHLNVAVVEDSWGDWMGAPEFAGGSMALVRFPISIMTADGPILEESLYRPLPTAGEYSIQNRFVGDHLLYGSSGYPSWYTDSPGSSQAVFVTDYRDDQGVFEIPLSHGVDRIEVMGSSAVVVGSNGTDLVFSAVALDETPQVTGTLVRENATQGERRSHGFFYLRESDTEGVLGLPVRYSGSSWQHLLYGSAEVLFLRVQEERSFVELGALSADAESAVDDACEVSCVDWYGNARPIFYHGRIFALLGYELVEGVVDQDSIVESRRVNFLRDR